MEMKEGTSVEAHLKSMKELTDKLAAIGAPISEEDQVVTLLGSVPHSYSTLVTALEARVDDVSLSYVQQALIHEERKKSVGLGNLPVGGGESGRQQSALVGRQGKGRRLRCYGCGGEGHFRRDCPKRRESSNPHTDKPVTEESHSHSEPDQSTGAFLASGKSHGTTGWLVDSGASSHMTCKRELLQEYKELRFSATKCWIRHSRGNVCGMGTLQNKMYQLNCEPVLQEHASVASENANVDLWHQRLGHPSESVLKEIVTHELVSGVKIPKRVELSFCEGCVEGKMQRKPVGVIRSKRKLQCVHSDVCGPMPTESIGGRKYFVTFIDDYSRCCSVYFMRHKSEVLDKFKEFEAATTTDSGQRMCTDNGGEYERKEEHRYPER
jgi:hypothetical protein